MHGNSAHKESRLIEISTPTPSPPRIVSAPDHCVSADRFNFRGVTSAEKWGAQSWRVRLATNTQHLNSFPAGLPNTKYWDELRFSGVCSFEMSYVWELGVEKLNYGRREVSTLHFSLLTFHLNDRYFTTLSFPLFQFQIIVFLQIGLINAEWHRLRSGELKVDVFTSQPVPNS